MLLYGKNPVEETRVDEQDIEARLAEAAARLSESVDTLSCIAGGLQAPSGPGVGTPIDRLRARFAFLQNKLQDRDKHIALLTDRLTEHERAGHAARMRNEVLRETIEQCMAVIATHRSLVEQLEITYREGTLDNEAIETFIKNFLEASS